MPDSRMRIGHQRSSQALLVVAFFLASIFFLRAARPEPESRDKTIDPILAQFVRQKRALTDSLAEKYDVKAPAAVEQFFDAAERGDWLSVSNTFNSLRSPSGYGPAKSVPQVIWVPIHETLGAYEQFQTCNLQLLKKFANEVIESIPSDSLFFGGTDAGRFVVSAFCRDQSEGRPFFTVTQNALADISYINYLRDIYGTKLTVPTLEDSQAAFQDYLADANRRLTEKKLKEGEKVTIVDGRVQVSGLIAVMEINERLVKIFLEKNAGRECFLEESYPLEGLNSRYLPHGLVLKISREPVERLPDSIIETDHQFWTTEVHSLIGSGVRETAPLPDLCSWLENLYLRLDYTSFDGNRAFLKDAQAPQYFSKCRGAIARIYEWRSKHSDRKADAAALVKEAEFAHRQAYTLAPFNPEEAWAYSSLLLNQKRTNDAKAVIQTTLKIDPSRWAEFNAAYYTNSLAKLRKKARELSVKIR